MLEMIKRKKLLFIALLLALAAVLTDSIWEEFPFWLGSGMLCAAVLLLLFYWLNKIKQDKKTSADENNLGLSDRQGGDHERQSD